MEWIWESNWSERRVKLSHWSDWRVKLGGKLTWSEWRVKLGVEWNWAWTILKWTWPACHLTACTVHHCVTVTVSLSVYLSLFLSCRETMGHPWHPWLWPFWVPGMRICPCLRCMILVMTLSSTEHSDALWRIHCHLLRVRGQRLQRKVLKCTRWRVRPHRSFATFPRKKKSGVTFFPCACAGTDWHCGHVHLLSISDACIGVC